MLNLTTQDDVFHLFNYSAYFFTSHYFYHIFWLIYSKYN